MRLSLGCEKGRPSFFCLPFVEWMLLCANMDEKLPEFFGREFTTDERKASYDFIEKFIHDNVNDWMVAPETDRIATAFAAKVKEFDNGTFNFLLCHSGYIPEFYEHDSSAETLYSKLIEVLVCEWAIRIGFVHSEIQKQKASKEDVTIRRANIVIVADAKSFRLGRSQAAPNVKDTIKKADYEKWQMGWKTAPPHPKFGEPMAIGGLITFPSQHRWKKSSDAYLYSTDKKDPIVILFYEYLAYFLIRGYTHEALKNLIYSYPKLFPEPSKSQHTYFEKVIGALFGDRADDLFEFMKLFAEIIREKIQHTIAQIENHVEKEKIRIVAEVDALSENVLRENLVEARVGKSCSQIIEQMSNIKKFRST
jgi:hypothetical protein